MTKSAMIKEMIMKLLSDGSPHTVSEMKDYLIEKDMEEYTEGLVRMVRLSAIKV